MAKKYFQLPLNLPHAGRVSNRINALLRPRVDVSVPAHQALVMCCNSLLGVLEPYVISGENPASAQAEEAQARAADLGRELVELLVVCGLTGDRIGQCVRNLFECLELGEEGADLSLRAGEAPDSLQRP